MIEGFFGLPGSGKTYSMVARLVDNLSRRKNKHRKVYANMSLDIPHLRKITGWQGTFYQLQDWTQLVAADNGLILLDELNLWMPSRVWAKVPGALLWKWAQVRKSGLEIWYTSQSPKRVDKVVRELTFISIFMTSFKFLGFFTGKVYAGIEDKFYCWNFMRFRKKAAIVYDTLDFVDVPAIYQTKIQNIDIVPFVMDEYVEPEKHKRKRKVKEKKDKLDNFKDVQEINYDNLFKNYIENLSKEDLLKIAENKVLEEKEESRFEKMFNKVG